MGPFVDRIEGTDAVVIIDGREQRMPLRALPPGAREGVYLSPDLRSVDEAATQAAARSVAERRGRLSKDDDGGDFSL